jgi:hypothetical protein
MEVPQNHPAEYDVPLKTIQLLGYPHDYGNPMTMEGPLRSLIPRPKVASC